MALIVVLNLVGFEPCFQRLEAVPEQLLLVAKSVNRWRSL